VTHLKHLSKLEQSYVGKVVEAVTNGEAKRAVKYISPEYVIRATFIGKRRDSYSSWDVRLTIGAPNYRERAFIRQCDKAGEKFPVKKIQLQFSKQ
jgi:hypothetical protein